MNFADTSFIIMVCASFFWLAMQWYTQIVTYPLFGWLGHQEFVPFHQEYERRLPLVLYLPYGVLIVSNAALLFTRPAEVSLTAVIVLLLLNLSIMVESLVLAVPVHGQLDREGKNAGKIRTLVLLNAIRLLIATIASGITAYLLAQVIGA